tara:strand:- start:41 stop:859 length:819 start_codon:yes stop_codon:yes gene_type:complete
MMAHVDLCSGIGGFALGFQWANLSKPVLFCDLEPWSRQVLHKHWPNVPIAEDVKELANDPDGFIPRTDASRTILTAGYPCQPFSFAGQRGGSKDDRHIWPEIFTIVQKKRYAWCVFENVFGHVSMGLDQVLSDMESAGYATRPFIVPACGVDAPHRRDRLWIIAHTNSQSEPNGPVNGSQGRRLDVGNAGSSGQRRDNGRWAGQEFANRCEDVAHTDRKRGQAPQQWLTEPAVGRVAHGIPKRVDRLRGLGNAIVPQIAMKIGEAIKQCEAL